MLSLDDDEAFEAALSFLDEYDFAATEQDANDGSSKPGDDKKRKRVETNARKRLLRKAGVYGDPNRARKERTREISDLREQLAKLQIDLKALKSGKQLQRYGSAASPRDSMVVVRSGAKVCGMWEELAGRQRHRREAAERYNMRLKLAVERQRKVAESLTDLLRKRSSQLETECSSLVSSAWTQPRVIHVMDFHGDAGEFEGLFRRLDTAYHELDAVFEANGLARMETSSSDVHLREGADGKYLEFFTNKVLPFGQRATGEAIWDHYKGLDKHLGSGYLYEKTAKDFGEPYTLMEEFTKEIYSNNARADVRMKQVVRRFVEQDRDLVVWVTSVSPVEIKHKILRGLTYHIRGYAVSTRAPASAHELSRLQLCTLITLDPEAETLYGADNLRMLTNFLIVYTAQNVRYHRDGIENILIDHAVSPRRP